MRRSVIVGRNLGKLALLKVSCTAGCRAAERAAEKHFGTSAPYVVSAGHSFPLFEAAPGSQAYNASYADDSSEVLPSPVQKATP